jgi:hypothetical protein
MDVDGLSDSQKAKCIAVLVEEGQHGGWERSAREELMGALAQEAMSTAAMDSWAPLWEAAAHWARLGDAEGSFGLARILERTDARFSGVWRESARELGLARLAPNVALAAAGMLSGRRLELRELCRGACAWMDAESFEMLAKAAKAAGFDAVAGIGGPEDDSMLSRAALAGNVEVGKWLLSKGAPIGSQELFSALAGGVVELSSAMDKNGLWRAKAAHPMMLALGMVVGGSKPKGGMGLAALLGGNSECVELALERGAWSSDAEMFGDAKKAWKMSAATGPAPRKAVLALARLVGGARAMSLAQAVRSEAAGTEELWAEAERLALREAAGRKGSTGATARL